VENFTVRALMLINPIETFVRVLVLPAKSFSLIKLAKIAAAWFNSL
jgi:hypothetical protein